MSYGRDQIICACLVIELSPQLIFSDLMMFAKTLLKYIMSISLYGNKHQRNRFLQVIVLKPKRKSKLWILIRWARLNVRPKSMRPRQNGKKKETWQKNGQRAANGFWRCFMAVRGVKKIIYFPFTAKGQPLISLIRGGWVVETSQKRIFRSSNAIK